MNTHQISFSWVKILDICKIKEDRLEKRDNENHLWDWWEMQCLTFLTFIQSLVVILNLLF